MPNYYKNPNLLNIEGYEIFFTRFSDSILNDHFQRSKLELESILSAFYIEETQVTKGGGGLSSITQKMAHLLNSNGWIKAKIQSEHHVSGRVLTSESHEVDHYKSFDKGNIGLEIEWNNKDPFYDRDLENFRKLHQIGELSVGIIITRGASLQIELFHVIHRFLNSIYPFSLKSLLSNINLSDAAKNQILPLLNLSKEESINRITAILYSSKYGAATTHMNKLILRLQRGVGNPCPLILIGIGKERLVRNTP